VRLSLVNMSKIKSIPEQLDEVASLTLDQLGEVANDNARPGLVRLFARQIIDKDAEGALKIIKNATRIAEASADIVDGLTVEELAIGDDDEAFYVSLIKQNVQQMIKKGTSPQEVARLSANINIFRKELRLIRSRSVKKGTTLDRVLTAAQKPVKTPSKGVEKEKSAKSRKPKAKN
jgi:hypothetical protein